MARKSEKQKTAPRRKTQAQRKTEAQTRNEAQERTETQKTVNLSAFAENPDNPQTVTDEAFARLVGKLRRVPDGLGAMRIAYVTDDPRFPGVGMVLSGNKRLRALKEIYGAEADVPAAWFEDITRMGAAERREFVIDANVNEGEWDLEKLLAQYETEELSEAGLDELLEDIGQYEKQEVDLSGGEIKNADLDKISIIIRFENEDAAQELFERLTKEGYKCELSTL